MTTPIEISYSRVQAYQRCPWLYHLVYNEGWRSGPNPSTALGQSLHKTLAAYFSSENDTFTQDRLMELYDQHWVNEGFGTPQETLDGYDRGRKMLEHFFQLDQSRQSKVEASEYEFIVDMDGVSFRGTIDRLDRLPDGSLEVIEYKTQGDHWHAERIANDLQMTFYALGCSKNWPSTPIRLKYYFLSNGESASTSRTHEQLTSAESLIKNTAEKLSRGEYPPHHAYCGRCEFGKRCKNFKQGFEI